MNLIPKVLKTYKRYKNINRKTKLTCKTELYILVLFNL